MVRYVAHNHKKRAITLHQQILQTKQWVEDGA